MEPRIQYVQTKDGVSIAYYTMGEGQPLVYMPQTPWSHLQFEWDGSVVRAQLDRLTAVTRMVRYDSRGSGLSDRDIREFSLDALLLDLEAVVDRLQLEKFALLAGHHSGPIAVAYAARHPERLSRLILRNTYARFSDWGGSPRMQALYGFVDKDWESFMETSARVMYGWADETRSREVAAFYRQCITQETARALYPAIYEFDVSALLPEVRAPTLVVHIQETQTAEVDAARNLAAGLPDARLAVVPDLDAMVSAVIEFLGEGEEAAAKAEPVPPAGLVTILFTDMESSTALTQRLGDAKAQELVRAHNAIVRDALKAHSGSEIKHTGDGIMASFATASSALECAITIQRAVSERQAEPVGDALRMRIGLNAGEPVAEEQDLFGTAVQLARRICDQAEAGEILVSATVRDLACTSAGVAFEDRGEHELKGIPEPVRLYEVTEQS